MKISIFGLGYVGCVSIGCLARNGHTITGVDVSKTKVDLINQGKPTIIEKDIDVIIQEEHRKGSISATTNFTEAVLKTDVSFICVGTPSTEKGHLNLEHIFGVARQIGEALKKKDSFHVVAVRSTVLPGTNMKVGQVIEEVSGKKRNVHFGVVSNPEFLREGSAVHDYYHPSVTVLGSDNPDALSVMEKIYGQIDAPIEKTEIPIAEIIKYVNNSYHALKITFANEVGNICKQMNMDSHKVMKLFCMDTVLNISPYYFKPGFAYGGSCLPKDLKALKTLAHDMYIQSPVIESIEKSNDVQKEIALRMIAGTGKKKVGIFGISFKPGTDDLRNSPIIDIIENLIGKGFQVTIYDENVNKSALIGANKEFIEGKLPHIYSIMTPELDEMTEKSEVIVLTNKDNRSKDLVAGYPNKIFIDLARSLDQVSDGNYMGISW